MVVDSATAVKPEKKTKKSSKKADEGEAGEDKPAKKSSKKAEESTETEKEAELFFQLLQIRHILSWYPWYHERMVYRLPKIGGYQSEFSPLCCGTDQPRRAIL